MLQKHLQRPHQKPIFPRPCISTPPPHPPTNLNFSLQQTNLLNRLLLGHNFYFTGKAGTGKSAVLEEFIKLARGMKKKVAVVAPSGITANNIGGQTIHSFAQLPINLDPLAETLAGKITDKTLITIRATDVLVMDEASLCHPDLFQKLDLVLRIVRGDVRSFGGMQVVISGDFYQLPPISPVQSRNHLKSLIMSIPQKNSGLESLIGVKRPEHTPLGRQFMNTGIRYMFDARSWRFLIESGMSVTELTHVFRQPDPEFQGILEDVRVGLVSDRVRNGLQTLQDKVVVNDGILATRLFVYRLAAERANMKRLGELEGEVMVFNAIDSINGLRVYPSHSTSASSHSSDSISSIHRSIFKTMQQEPHLKLKLNAQVILTRNLLSRGLVNGSRGVVVGFKGENETLVPIVRFICHRLLNSKPVKSKGESESGEESKDGVVEIAVGYYDHRVDTDGGSNSVVRRQIPLQLGWALTIHKSQDMPQSFSPGHAYVGLSRCKSLSSLHLGKFSLDAIYANARVDEFYKGLWGGSNHVDLDVDVNEQR